MRRMFATIVLVLATAAGGQEKTAAEKKVVKDAELTKKESNVGPDKTLAGEITRKKTDAGKAAPALQYDQFRLGVELQVASKRREQIEDLKKIIELSKDAKEMPKLLFRLGELYWEESQYYFFEANRKDDDLIAALNRDDKAGQERAKAEKEDLLGKQKEFANLAVDRYRDIVQKYKDFERTDEVLFFLGKNLMDMGDEKRSLVSYKRLIDKYPKSKYLPDAYLAFGEYYFNGSKGKRDQIEKALENYTKASGFPDSHVYGFAIYKQGWCYFNLTDYEKAMDRFKTVVLYGKIAGTAEVEGEKGKPNARTGLVKEARGDYVRSYGRTMGSPTEGKEKFKSLADKPDDLRLMMKQLANLYYEDGKDKEAALAYDMLIKERPTSPEAPGFQGKIIDCVLRAGNKQMTVQQVRRLVKIMDDVNKGGMVKDEKDKNALEEAKELSERIISNLAVNWHNEARKTRDDQTYGFANEVYGDYLTLFPENNKAYDLRFFWAELLNDNLNKYDKAADEYTKVLLVDVGRIEKKNDKGEPGKPGKYMLNAAYNAILAEDEVVKKCIADGKCKAEIAKDPNQKLNMPPEKKALLDACERYLKYVPNGEKKVEIAYKAARIYYEFNNLDEAIARFADISINNPEYKFEDGTKVCEITANLVTDSYNIKGDIAKINEWSRKFASEKCADHNPTYKAEMVKLAEQSTFKLANQLDSQKEYEKAAQAYMGFVNEFPKSDLSDKALFNAAIDFFNAKKLDQAIEIRKKLITDPLYAKSTYIPQTVFALAEGYEAITDFEQAAQYYERFVAGFVKDKSGGGAKKGPAPKRAAPVKGKNGKATAKKDDEPKGGDQNWDESKAQIALFNAGVFREGLGQYKQALKDREEYLDLWPEAKDYEQVFLSLVNLHETNGAYGKAAKQLEDYEKKYVKDPNKVLVAEGRIATLYEEKMKNSKAARKVYDRVLDYYEKLPTKTKKGLEIAALDPVARAHFLNNEDDFRKYSNIKLKWSKLQNVGELKGSIKDKSHALEGITKLYTDTVALKSADPAICALHKIGLAYDQFAENLGNPPIPKGVPDDLVFELKAQFDEQARPVKDKAAEAFAAAVQKSHELDVFNPCTIAALEKLRDRYRPEQYPQMFEDKLEIKLENQSSMALGGDFLTNIQQTVDKADPEKVAMMKNQAGSVTAPERTAPRDMGESDPPAPKNTAVSPAPAPKKSPPSTGPSDKPTPTNTKKPTSDEPQDEPL